MKPVVEEQLVSMAMPARTASMVLGPKRNPARAPSPSHCQMRPVRISTHRATIWRRSSMAPAWRPLRGSAPSGIICDVQPKDRETELVPSTRRPHSGAADPGIFHEELRLLVPHVSFRPDLLYDLQHPRTGYRRPCSFAVQLDELFYQVEEPFSRTASFTMWFAAVWTVWERWRGIPYAGEVVAFEYIPPLSPSCRG
jgi:hypothetical protein